MQATYKRRFLHLLVRSFCVLFVFHLLACKKFVDVPVPGNQIVSAKVFGNDQTATAAVVGLYDQIMRNNKFFLNGGTTLYPALSADELERTSALDAEDAFTTNSLTPLNQVVKNDLWRFAYSFIYSANACIEGLTQSTSITPALKNQLLGEAKIIRSLCYYYLLNLYGDVPLVLTTNYLESSLVPRTPASQVMQQITGDAEEAKSLLAQAPVNDPTRVNKWAATALLARLYLYAGNYSQAEAQATAVIGAGRYVLETSLSNVFLVNSKEVILQFQPVLPDYNTAEGNLFIPVATATRKPTYVLTASLFNAFETGDQRKVAWMKNKTVSGQNFYYPFKYTVRVNPVPGSAPTEDNVVFRLAECYLIRAEARAQLNNIAGAQADLNRVRNRAGLPNTTATDKASLLTAILHERQVELFAEWGHRFFDLKRFSLADAVLGPQKAPNWTSTDALYPIPLSELQANPALVQNPGY